MKTRPMTTRIDREYTDRSAELEKKVDEKIKAGGYSNTEHRVCTTREMTKEERKRYGVEI